MKEEWNEDTRTGPLKGSRVLLNKVIRKYNKWFCNDAKDMVKSSKMLDYIEEHLRMNYSKKEANIELRLELEEMRRWVDAVLDDNVYKIKFKYGGRWSYNIPNSCIGDNKSGWKVSGEIYNECYEWVQYFEAEHPKHGRVWGDFEKTVYATSEKAYKKFIKKHPPEEGDYWDI